MNYRTMKGVVVVLSIDGHPTAESLSNHVC